MLHYPAGNGTSWARSSTLHRCPSRAAWRGLQKTARVRYQPDHASTSMRGGAEKPPHPSPQQQDHKHLGPAQPDADAMRVIGLGQRGISAAARLTANEGLKGAETWMLDTDAKVSCNTTNILTRHCTAAVQHPALQGHSLGGMQQ